MQINLLFLFLLLIYHIISLDFSYVNFNYLLDKEMGISEFYKIILESLTLTNITSINSLNINEKCMSKLNNTYFLTTNFTDENWINRRKIDKELYYYTKLFLSSSKNKNDLGSPEKCQNENDKDFKDLLLSENTTYISVLIEKEKSFYELLKNDNNDFDAYNFFGLCIVDGCEKEDYIKLISNIINNIKNDNSENNKFIQNKEEDTSISIYYLKNKIPRVKIYVRIFKFIPLIFISIHILFIIFNSIPLFLYNSIICIFCCESNRKKRAGNIKIKRVLSKDKGQLVSKDANYSINSSNNSTSLSYSSNFEKVNEMINILYNIEKNFISLKSKNKDDDTINDSGLSYINGLKGISMIFLVFGNVYIAIYNSPLMEPNIYTLYQNLKNLGYFVFYCGIKFSPKILLCCSGFTLFYKFVCFLDDKIELEKEIIKQREEKANKNDDSNIKNDNSTDKSNKNKKSNGNMTFNFNSLVLVKYLSIFMGYQLHKYFLYLLMMGFFLYSFYDTVSFFHGPGQTWDFFDQKIVRSSYKLGKLIPLLFGFQGYLLPFLRNEKYNILNYFNIVYQEIFYFIITSIFIFIGYKRNLKIDRFIKYCIVFLFLLKIICSFCFRTLNIRDYFSFQSFGLFYSSIFYNYIYYLIGIYFSMLNYVIQKRYSILDCKKNKKSYLIRSTQIINIIKKRKKFPIYLTIIIVLFLLFFVFLQQILIYLFEFTNDSIKDTMKSYDSNIFVDILLLIDTDIIILAINIMVIIMYLKGNNIIINFINNNFWSLFNKLYFSYILLINPIILYVIYISETKIELNLKNCFLYSIISGILIFSSTSFVYVFFELPYRKAVRYWFKLSERVINDERFNNLESNFNLSLNENQSDLVEDSNSDEEEFIEDEEDEEDYD